MTPEERLSQAEKLLETAARYIDRHSQMHEQSQAEISQLRVSINETLGLFAELANYQRQNQEEIRLLREETRLIREETQRIWEYLLRQSGNGHSGT